MTLTCPILIINGNKLECEIYHSLAHHVIFIKALRSLHLQMFSVNVYVNQLWPTSSIDIWVNQCTTSYCNVLYVSINNHFQHDDWFYNQHHIPELTIMFELLGRSTHLSLTQKIVFNPVQCKLHMVRNMKTWYNYPTQIKTWWYLENTTYITTQCKWQHV